MPPCESDPRHVPLGLDLDYRSSLVGSSIGKLLLLYQIILSLDRPTAACYYSVRSSNEGSPVEVEIYASDAFTAKKEELLSRFESEYRFEKGDELYIERADGRSLRVRLIDVRVHVGEGGSVKSELLAVKL